MRAHTPSVPSFGRRTPTSPTPYGPQVLYSSPSTTTSPTITSPGLASSPMTLLDPASLYEDPNKPVPRHHVNWGRRVLHRLRGSRYDDNDWAVDWRTYNNNGVGDYSRDSSVRKLWPTRKRHSRGSNNNASSPALALASADEHNPYSSTFIGGHADVGQLVATVPLTTRNLTELLNPDFEVENEEVFASIEWERREKHKRERVFKWLDRLP